MTPGSRSKTASMHQKQPPPRSAISILFVSVVFMTLVVEPASAAKLSAAMDDKRQTIDFMSLRTGAEGSTVAPSVKCKGRAHPAARKLFPLLVRRRRMVLVP